MQARRIEVSLQGKGGWLFFEVAWLYKREYTLVTTWRSRKLNFKYCPFLYRFVFSRLWYLLVLLFWLVVFWANPNLVSMVFHLQGRCNVETKESGDEIELIQHPFRFSLAARWIECDQKQYLHNETKGGICLKIEFNPQKNISLLQHGRRFFVYSSNMAAVTSYEQTL